MSWSSPNSLEKAKRTVAALVKKYRGWPEEVALTFYRDAAHFESQYPGEDYADHLQQRDAFVAWLQANNVIVKHVMAPDSFRPLVPRQRAEHALNSLPFRKGDPYRLGMKLGHAGSINNDEGHYGYLGWSIVALGKVESGER